MKKDNWIVTTEDERPARKDGTCFYCAVPIGGEHKQDCVIRERTIVCDIKIRMVRKVPEDWDVHMIEFSMNDSSSCFNNILHEIDDMAERCGCLCSFAKGKYIGEAGPGDEEHCNLFINPEASAGETISAFAELTNASSLTRGRLPAPRI